MVVLLSAVARLPVVLISSWGRRPRVQSRPDRPDDARPRRCRSIDRVAPSSVALPPTSWARGRAWLLSRRRRRSSPSGTTSFACGRETEVLAGKYVPNRLAWRTRRVIRGRPTSIWSPSSAVHRRRSDPLSRRCDFQGSTVIGRCDASTCPSSRSPCADAPAVRPDRGSSAVTIERSPRRFGPDDDPAPERGAMLTVRWACQREWLHGVPRSPRCRNSAPSLVTVDGRPRGRPDTRPTYYDGAPLPATISP